ncbi:hypothetical protein DFJ74DRAFT_768358 [Hyaloraphidium curvatum]|nr:hypothetical protein DFJ74DRAFT_768358 [Hyaloraphidium curvatum]
MSPTARVPWRYFTSPAAKWAAQPTFVLGEACFLVLALACFAHARTQPTRSARQRHTAAWLAALLAGTANDLIFMEMLPTVDNFWHGQAVLMLSPRLPAYICALYICFMYIPAVAAWRAIPSSGLARAALAGLLGVLFYAPFDVTGAKFLWWTWHESDVVIAKRILGVPVSSTLFVLTFVGSFSWLLGLGPQSETGASPSVFLPLLRATLFSTFAMVAQITVLQQLEGGTPGYLSLAVGAALYASIALVGFSAARSAYPSDRSPADRSLFLSIAAYLILLPTLVASFRPESHHSAGIHQTFGPCGVKALDIAGNERDVYVCGEPRDGSYTFSCLAGMPDEGAEWYTVCGAPFDERGRWIAAVGGMAAAGMAAYAAVLMRGEAGAAVKID